MDITIKKKKKVYGFKQSLNHSLWDQKKPW